jgi:hypothetical protein
MNDPAGEIARIFGSDVLAFDELGRARIIRTSESVMVDLEMKTATWTGDNGRVAVYDWSEYPGVWRLVS